MKPNKKALNFIDIIFLCLTCLLCLSLFFSYLAGQINPQKAWIFAFFGLAYPPLILCTVIMVIYWLLRRRLYALLPIITILIGWNVLLNNIGFNLPADSDNDGKNRLTFMTYNVHSFKIYGEDNDRNVKHEFLELIRQEAPDIIGMQEFYTRKRGEYDMIDSLKRIMNCKDYFFEPLAVGPDESMGLAVFSKYRILGHGLVKFAERSGNQCMYVDIEKNGARLRLYNVHLQSIHFDWQDYQYLGNLSNKGKTDIPATRRLGSKLKRAFIKRSEQVLMVKEHAKTCPYPYIISGDFNDTPASFAATQMAKGLKNAFREKGSGLGRTYNGDFPNYQIDYVMVSPEIEVKDYRIITKKLSDHYAVTTDLALN